MASEVSIERALAAIEAVEELQFKMRGILDLLKNLSERLVALENPGKAAPKSK